MDELKRAVVDELLRGSSDAARSFPWAGMYEEWFFEADLWKSGDPFPWNDAAPKGCREVAKLFARRWNPSQDIQDAAEEMKRQLARWKVWGIDDEDVVLRPWFVGRCFLEFLSQKHFSEQEQKELDAEGSLYWLLLKRLPSGEEVQRLWEPLADSKAPGELTSDDLWSPVRKGLMNLAEKLQVEGRAWGSDAALVQKIGNALRHIGQRTTEKARYEQEAERLDANLRKVKVGNPDRQQMLEKLTEIEREVGAINGWLAQRLRCPPDELPNNTTIESKNERCNELWKRLTGENGGPRRQEKARP
ncbi:MAG TPA: hypothetical protein EYH34_11960 [Planctomycetes bacterium]|nr:hypothetical protein [Planctomycetota bacterium]